MYRQVSYPTCLTREAGNEGICTCSPATQWHWGETACDEPGNKADVRCPLTVIWRLVSNFARPYSHNAEADDHQYIDLMLNHRCLFLSIRCLCSVLTCNHCYSSRLMTSCYCLGSSSRLALSTAIINNPVLLSDPFLRSGSLPLPSTDVDIRYVNI